MSDDILIQRFEETLTRYHLCEKGERILLAFSGGVDSTGLLALFLDIRERWSLDLSLGHLHHMIRKEADGDAAHIQDIARKFSIPLYIEKSDVQAYARREKINLEEAGRILRYDFLRKVLREIGASKIATGHTLNDQAETFLIRLLRGSGRRGLAGIFSLVDNEIIRPLLMTERHEIKGFITERGLPYRMDKSNTDRRFLRNKIRLELLPYLKENYDPQIVSHLGKSAILLQDEELLLEQIVQEKTQDLVSSRKGELSLDLARTSTLPRGLSRRIIRNFISASKGDLSAVSFEDIENILRVREGKKVSISGRTLFRREKDRMYLEKAPDREKKYHYEWDGEQSLEILETGMKFNGKRMFSADTPFAFDDDNRVYLDMDTLILPFHIRNRKEGDRYHSLGAPGSQKVKEIMRAKKIPARERGENPVFLSADKIVWIKGLPVSEKNKVTPSTKNVLCVYLDGEKRNEP